MAVVHADDGRLVRSRCQGAIEELQLLVAQFAVTGTRHQCVQHDQPDRKFVHGVLYVMGIRGDAAQVLQSLAKIAPPVMVAGDDEHRHWQESAQQPVQVRVLLVQAAIGQVAGDDHHIGARVEPGHRPERPFGEHVGLAQTIGGFSHRPDMQVGELADQHEALLRTEVPILAA
jgi:hypothetical protein